MHIMKTILSFLAAAVIATISTMALAQNCNPNIPLTKPDSRYTYNTVGDEVTDTFTGLIWKRCVEGMSWNGSICTGTPTEFTWEDALIHAGSVAQTTGLAWRLPNIKELISLVENACYYPAINEKAFPSAPLVIWSSSFFERRNLIVSFDGGSFIYYSESFIDSAPEFGRPRIRLVRD